MDDFLHNLRKNTDRNFDKRRQNPQYRSPERRGLRDQQQHRPFQKRSETPDVMTDMVTEMVPDVKALLVKIEDLQKRMTDAAERGASAIEKQTAVLESIAGVLSQLVSKSSAEAGIADPDPCDPPTECDPSLCSEEKEAAASVVAERDAVVDLIVGLREGGMTYKEIAQRLDEDNIPTFSGKGAWHAQTVHKVCRKGA